MNPIVILGFLLFAAVAGDVALGITVHAKNVQIDADAQKLTDMTGQRDAQVAGLNTCQGESKRQQSIIDELNDASVRAANDQQKAAQQLSTSNASLKADNDQLFQQLEEALNARPTQVNVSGGYPTGWDPLAASAADYVRRLQLTPSPGNGNAAVDRVPGQNDPGGPAASGASAGSGIAGVVYSGGAEARPNAKQQLDLIGYVSQLYQWGASCYRDKAAIAASQKIGDVSP